MVAFVRAQALQKVVEIWKELVAPALPNEKVEAIRRLFWGTVRFGVARELKKDVLGEAVDDSVLGYVGDGLDWGAEEVSRQSDRDEKDAEAPDGLRPFVDGLPV